MDKPVDNSINLCCIDKISLFYTFLTPLHHNILCMYSCIIIPMVYTICISISSNINMCKIQNCRGCDYELDSKLKEYKKVLCSKDMLYSVLAFTIGIALVVVVLIITE